jgi:DNA-binding LacI/PurR family transcriptional regulator
MPDRRVSIKDVARAASVSVTTVSHALNDKGRLNPLTRRRVQEVADRLGYRPNPAARSLVSGSTRLIAAVPSLPAEPRIEFTAFTYFTELIGAATGAAVARDYALVVAPPTTNGFVWERVPLDGVIVIDPVVDEPALPALRERGIPFVTVEPDPAGSELDIVVGYDVDAATRAVLDHLGERGGRRVALLTVPPVNAFLQDTAGTYERWCEELGVRPIVGQLDIAELLRDAAAEIDRVLGDLRQREAFDALYAPIEQIGILIGEVLSARGLHVPSDVLLATTHDAGRAAVADPAITTLAWDCVELGRRAADALLDLVEGRCRPPMWVNVDTVVVPRASTLRS